MEQDHLNGMCVANNWDVGFTDTITGAFKNVVNSIIIIL